VKIVLFLRGALSELTQMARKGAREMDGIVEKLSKGVHVTIVALGDSITAYSIHNRGYMNWVSLLEEAIAEKYGWGNCCLINSGVPGDSFASALQRLDRDVLRFHPDLVIIALGMNDAGKGAEHLPQFRKEAHTLIERIKRGANCEILVRTPNPIIAETGLRWNPKADPGEVADFNWGPLEDYANALCEIAREAKCTFIDHYHLWKAVDFPVADLHDKIAYQYKLWPRMANSTHPGPLGQLAFYRELAPHFKLPERFPWELTQ
jgi:acyl-CoA thioesterase I